MNQAVWGPNLWFSLHSITFMYPLNPTPIDKKNYYDFFMSLKNVLPCSVCRKNYERHLYESPINDALESRKNLVLWLIDLHNLVNAETGKQFMNPNKVIKRYEEIYNTKFSLDSNNEKKIVNTINNNEIPQNNDTQTINYKFTVQPQKLNYNLFLRGLVWTIFAIIIILLCYSLLKKK